jgi:WD40 repeat protein
MLGIGFSADNRFVSIEYDINQCEVYDRHSGTFRTIASDPADRIFTSAHAFSPDSRLFARSAIKLPKLQPTKVWQLDPWREVADSTGLLAGADILLFKRESRSLIAMVNAAAIRWTWLPREEPNQPEGHKDEAWAAGFSTDGQLLVTASDDTDDPQTLKLWDVATGRLVLGWNAHEAMTSAVAFQSGGRIIASSALRADKNLRLWDAGTGSLLATLAGHTDWVRTVAFSPDGRMLASAGSDRIIRLWDVAGRRCARALSGHSDRINQVAFSQDGRTLASASNDCTVRLWSGKSGEALQTWRTSKQIRGVAFSPDGGSVCWAQEDGIIQRQNLAGGPSPAALHSEYDELRCLAFSPDGRTLAAAGKSGRIHFWDPVSGQELLTVEGRPCQVNALAFSPNGSAMAVCFHDGTVRMIRSR